MTPRRDVSMSPEEVAAFFHSLYTGILSTLGRDGFPHSTAMWFVPDAGTIRMWAYRKSQKARNLARDARCAFMVEEGTHYEELRGVLVRARARLVEDPVAVEQVGCDLYRRYTEPRTGVPLEAGPIVEIRRQAAKRIGIVLPTSRVASWDHSKL